MCSRPTFRDESLCAWFSDGEKHWKLISPISRCVQKVCSATVLEEGSLETERYAQILDPLTIDSYKWERLAGNFRAVTLTTPRNKIWVEYPIRNTHGLYLLIGKDLSIKNSSFRQVTMGIVSELTLAIQYLRRKQWKRIVLISFVVGSIVEPQKK